MTAPTTVALYGRVSSEEQADRGTIEAQKQFLAEYARLYGLHVAGGYFDEGISGTVPLEERPAGARLLADARDGRFGVVLVYRLDRLGRSLKATVGGYEALAQCGVGLRSATEPFDTATPFGRFVFQFLGSLAELERETIVDRLVLGRDRVARTGVWTGGTLPFGYDLDDAGRLVLSRRLVPGLGQTEAALARELFARVAGGSSTVAEARRLNALGVPNEPRFSSGRPIPTASPRWTPVRVSYLLRNPIYVGRALLRSRNGTLDRAAPALVDAETWEAVRAQLVRNTRKPPGNTRHRYLLRGLIRCARCGRGYTGVEVSRGRRYYRCTGQVEAKQAGVARCPAKQLNADAIEALVWQDCLAWLEHPDEAARRARQRLDARLTREANTTEAESRRLTRVLAGKQLDRDRLLTLFRRGRLPLADLERQLAAVEAEAEDVRAQLRAVASREELAADLRAHVDRAGLLLRQLATRLPSLDDDAQWEFRRRVIELLVVELRVQTDAETPTRPAEIAITYLFGPPPDQDARYEAGAEGRLSRPWSASLPTGRRLQIGARWGVRRRSRVGLGVAAPGQDADAERHDLAGRLVEQTVRERALKRPGLKQRKAESQPGAHAEGALDELAERRVKTAHEPSQRGEERRLDHDHRGDPVDQAGRNQVEHHAPAARSTPRARQDSHR